VWGREAGKEESQCWVEGMEGKEEGGGAVTKTKPEFKNKVYHRRKTTGLEKVDG